MALAPIAPWTIPPDFLGAARAGASLGLEQRGQDIAQGEAADRLKLAYDQLASEEATRARESAAKLDLAHSALALRGQQMAGLQDYREKQIADAQQRMGALADYRDKKLQQATAAAELRKRNIHFAPNGEVLQLQDDGTVKQLREPTEKPAKGPTLSLPMDPANPFGAKLTGPLSDPEMAARFKTLSDSPAAPAGDKPTGFNLLSPSTWFGGGAAPAAGSPGPAPAPAAGFSSPAQVKEAVASGKLSREDGVKVLREQFGYE